MPSITKLRYLDTINPADVINLTLKGVPVSQREYEAIERMYDCGFGETEVRDYIRMHRKPVALGLVARNIAIRTAQAAIAERDHRIQLHTEKAAVAATCLADARNGRPGNIMIDGFSQQLASHNAAIELCRAEKAEFERQLAGLVGDTQQAAE